MPCRANITNARVPYVLEIVHHFCYMAWDKIILYLKDLD